MLLSEKNFDVALDRLNSSNPTTKDLYYNRSCFEIFDYLLGLYEEDMKNPRLRNQMVKELVNYLKKTHPHLSKNQIKKRVLPNINIKDEILIKFEQILKK